MFKKDELKKIEEAVARAELKTSGEIVPMVVPASSSYSYIYLLFALIGFGASSVYLLLVPPPWGESYGVVEMLLVQLSGSALFSLPIFFPFIRRLFVSKKKLSKHVYRASLSNFMAAGLLETRDRTGILIYLSRFERSAVILADKGINDYTPDGYWQNQVDLIIDGIKTKNSATAICRAIDEMGDKLSEKFPPRSDDTDELSNRVRLEREDS